MRGAEIYEKYSFSDIFSCLGRFLHVFVQDKDWDILKTHEMIRVSQLVTYPIVFNLLYDISL